MKITRRQLRWIIKEVVTSQNHHPEREDVRHLAPPRPSLVMMLESRHHNHEHNFYVKTVLGIDAPKMLLESGDRRSVEARILKEHLLLENWLKNTAKQLKQKSVDAFEAIKEKGVSAVEAMKEFPGKVNGILAAFYKIMTDEAEAKAYLTGTLGSSRHKGFKKQLLRIKRKFEEYGMPTFAKMIGNFVDVTWGLLEKARAAGGWRGFLGVLVFGIAVGKIKDQFGEQIGRLKELLDELGDSVKEKLKNASKDDAKKLLSDLMNSEKVQQRIIDATGFVEKAKKMATGALQKLAGSALESFAGPVAWLKKAAGFFGMANDFVDAIGEYFRRGLNGDQVVMKNESLLRRYVRQTLIVERNRHRVGPMSSSDRSRWRMTENLSSNTLSKKAFF